MSSIATEVYTPERWRKPVSFAFAAIWLGMAFFTIPLGFDTGWHVWLEMIGYLMLSVAALGRIWSFAFIGGRKNSTLCQSGPYSLTRNPLYLFSFIGLCGAGLALEQVMLTLGAAVIFLSYYAWVIRSEERRLAGIHGAAFERYCAAVPRFWPRLAAPEVDGEITLSARLFTRHLTEVFWFLAAIALIEMIEEAKLNHWWRLWVTYF